MPLIKSSVVIRRKIKANLPDPLITEIESYAAWAQASVDDFLEQASMMVLLKDKEWHELQQRSDGNE